MSNFCHSWIGIIYQFLHTNSELQHLSFLAPEWAGPVCSSACPSCWRGCSTRGWWTSSRLSGRCGPSGPPWCRPRTSTSSVTGRHWSTSPPSTTTRTIDSQPASSSGSEETLSSSACLVRPSLRHEDTAMLTLCVAGTLQAKSRPFVSVTMEMPGGSDSDDSCSFWSNIYTQSPVKLRPHTGENGFYMNGFTSSAPPAPACPCWRSLLASWLECLPCTSCHRPAPARVYGRSEPPSAPPHSDSPPYLPSAPSAPHRHLLNGHSHVARDNGHHRPFVRDLPV